MAYNPALDDKYIAACVGVVRRAHAGYEREYIAHHEGEQADRRLAGCLGAFVVVLRSPSWPKNGMGVWLEQQMRRDRGVQGALASLRQRPDVWPTLEADIYAISPIARAMGYN